MKKLLHNSCFVFAADAKRGLNYWRIIDRIIQEITLQQNDGTDPDMAPIDIHVKHIIDKYVLSVTSPSS